MAPSTGPSVNTARWAVIPGMPRLAPSSSLRWPGQGHGQVAGDDSALGGGPEGPVGLRAVDPHALPEPAVIDTDANGVDDAGRVAVRDHPREGHRGTEPAAPLLGIARVDTRNAHPNADLARAGIGVPKLADLEHLSGGTLPLIPGRKHENLRGPSAGVLAGRMRHIRQARAASVVRGSVIQDFVQPPPLGAAGGAGD